MNKIKELKRIADENPNGFTVWTTDLTPVTQGWVVAMKETQNSFGNAGLIKVLAIAESTSKVIGGWKEGKQFYWDAVLLFDNEQAAIEEGIKNQQIAIYNIETNYLKYL